MCRNATTQKRTIFYTLIIQESIARRIAWQYLCHTRDAYCSATWSLTEGGHVFSRERKLGVLFFFHKIIEHSFAACMKWPVFFQSKQLFGQNSLEPRPSMVWSWQTSRLVGNEGRRAFEVKRSTAQNQLGCLRRCGQTKGCFWTCWAGLFPCSFVRMQTETHKRWAVTNGETLGRCGPSSTLPFLGRGWKAGKSCTLTGTQRLISRSCKQERAQCPPSSDKPKNRS